MYLYHEPKKVVILTSKLMQIPSRLYVAYNAMYSDETPDNNLIIHNPSTHEKQQSQEKPHANALSLPENAILFNRGQNTLSRMRLLHLVFSLRVTIRRIRVRHKHGGRIQIKAIGDQIHLHASDEAGALDELPAEEHGDHDWDFDVVGDEVDGFEVGAEAVPALDEDDDGIQADRDGGTDGVRPVFEGEEVLEALFADGAAETEGGYADADP